MNCKARILIIEGQPAVLMMMVYLLTRAECDVTAVQSGTEAIKRAKREEFDLVIMDIDVPGANGLEVCAYLKQDFRFSRTPIIFVSSHDWEEDQHRSFEFGAADYITKPFDGALFVRKILSHIKKPTR